MISLHIMPNSLVVVLDSGTFILSANDPRYTQILRAEINEDRIRQILEYKEAVKENEKENKENDRLEVKAEEDTILIDKQEMPKGIKDKFLELQRRHKPRSYLLKFWDKLQKNPNPNSIRQLYKFLEFNGHPIMADGSFIAYKAVTMDLFDHHSKTNKHHIGRVIKMERGGVDSDPNQTCSTGLHVCAKPYLKEFFPNASRYLEVLVDPRDVVAVPTDYQGSKMRVARYKVYRETTLAKLGE